MPPPSFTPGKAARAAWRSLRPSASRDAWRPAARISDPRRSRRSTASSFSRARAAAAATGASDAAASVIVGNDDLQDDLRAGRQPAASTIGVEFGKPAPVARVDVADEKARIEPAQALRRRRALAAASSAGNATPRSGIAVARSPPSVDVTSPLCLLVRRSPRARRRRGARTARAGCPWRACSPTAAQEAAHRSCMTRRSSFAGPPFRTRRLPSGRWPKARERPHG